MMNITPFLYMHNPFTNEKINVYLDKHSLMSFGTNDNKFKQISHLSRGVVIESSA